MRCVLCDTCCTLCAVRRACAGAVRLTGAAICLQALLRETKAAFDEEAAVRRLKAPLVITMAYYPDGRQEQLLHDGGAEPSVDLFHMMSYDQPGAQHSSVAFGELAVQRGVANLRAAQLTMGLPFYGRHSRTGDWVTYEDIVQQHALVGAAKQTLDSVPVAGGTLGFNGVATIGAKTRFAVSKRLGGVMIWEVGQDCRVHPVTHGETTHVSTCPDGEQSSLLVAIARAMREAGVVRARRGMPSGGGSKSGNDRSELR